jgi:hypothetical protein
MCDYSLEHLESRPAKVGDKLVSAAFINSLTRGLASPDALNVAVCLRPGAELAFGADIECDYTQYFLFSPKKFTGMRTAIFRQLHMDKPHQHHDALELPDGHFILLTRLVSGQIVTVLQVPAEIVEAKPAALELRAPELVMPF